MDQEIGEMTFCSNCHRNIKTSTFDLHESHCRRHIQYCVECDEGIPRNEYQAHVDECHAPCPCPLCGTLVPKHLMDDHQESSCPDALVECKYCELEKKRRDYSEHVDQCGSRTDFCELCNMRVILRDMQEHRAMKCGHVKAELPLDPHTVANLDDPDDYVPSSHFMVHSPSSSPDSAHHVDPQWLESVSGVCEGEELHALLAQNMFYADMQGMSGGYSHGAVVSEPDYEDDDDDDEIYSARDNEPDTELDSDLARRLQDEEIRRDRIYERDQTLAQQLHQKEETGRQQPTLVYSPSLPRRPLHPPPLHTSHSPPHTDSDLARMLQEDENQRDKQFGRDLQLAQQIQREEDKSVRPHPHEHSYAINSKPLLPSNPYYNPPPPTEADEEIARKLQVEEDRLQFVPGRSHDLYTPRPDVSVLSHDDDMPRPKPLPVQQTEDDRIPCQFCSKSFPVNQITHHQSRCTADYDSGPLRPDYDSGPLRSDYDSGPLRSDSPGPTQRRVLTKATMDMVTRGEDFIERNFVQQPKDLECQFCQKTVPSDNLSVHEALCENNPDSELKHVYTPSHAPSEVEVTVDEDLVPCETCAELMPLSTLYRHQVRCSLMRGKLNHPRPAKKRQFNGTSHTTPCTQPTPHTTPPTQPTPISTLYTQPTPHSTPLTQAVPQASKEPKSSRGNRKLAIVFPGQPATDNKQTNHNTLHTVSSGHTRSTTVGVGLGVTGQHISPTTRRGRQGSVGISRIPRLVRRPLGDPSGSHSNY